MKLPQSIDHFSGKTTSFLKKRQGGILLHPTSLPGKFGIGDLGPEFYRFIDFLHLNRQNILQILPLGHTGYGNSPYQSFSAFAGNPLLISPEILCENGLLTLEEFQESRFSKHRVQFSKIIEFKSEILDQVYTNFKKKPFSSLQAQYKIFKNNQYHWLDEYALFMSIKEDNNFHAWNTWDESLKLRKSQALSSWKKTHQDKIEYYKFSQFLFFYQWEKIKKYAHNKNVTIIGDIPIFVAYDSADVWANPHLFYLDKDGEMEYVSGVPPDYFSETGQRWGNPIYHWDLIQANNYNWWIQRINHSFSLVDILRIDHFRGFESYWRIPADETTAINGEWIKGPGINLFNALKKACGFLPIIAENLGIITPAVNTLLQQTGFPGMRVLQFAFGFEEKEGIENEYLPHNYIPNTVVYTGTHDNDTTLSWFKTAPIEIQNEVLAYLHPNSEDIVGDLIRLAWSSVAKISVIPLQDLLRLGTEGRMNFPGTESGNWEWRFTWKQLTEEHGKEIAKLSKIFQRHVS